MFSSHCVPSQLARKLEELRECGQRLLTAALGTACGGGMKRAPGLGVCGAGAVASFCLFTEDGLKYYDLLIFFS